MSSILIREVSADVHSRLQARAQAEGKSLQGYLIGELTRLAERPSMDEVLARISERRGGVIGFQQAVSDLEFERARQ